MQLFPYLISSQSPLLCSSILILFVCKRYAEFSTLKRHILGIYISFLVFNDTPSHHRIQEPVRSTLLVCSVWQSTFVLQQLTLLLLFVLLWLLAAAADTHALRTGQMPIYSFVYMVFVLFFSFPSPYGIAMHLRSTQSEMPAIVSKILN